MRHATTISAALVHPAVPTVQSAAGGVDESFRHAGGEASRPAEIVLQTAPEGWMLGAELRVRSGAATGATLRVAYVDGARVVLEPGQSPQMTTALSAGDEVVLDNSAFLAAQTFHRHQVPGPDYPVYDRYRDAEGRPIPPQRSMLLGPMFSAAAAGSVPAGSISGKMIVVSCLLDREAFPWQADWYRQRVTEHLGADVDDHFRLWYIDNALHGDDETQVDQTHTVSYLGALHTALRQVAAWVESDVAPAPSTAYSVADGQVRVPGSAAERRGVQPVVRMTVDGNETTTARIGQTVRLQIVGEVPDGEAPIVAMSMDLSGAGTLGPAFRVKPTRQLIRDIEVVFDTPGTRFLAARVTSQGAADGGTAVGRIHNIARLRVVVTDGGV